MSDVLSTARTAFASWKAHVRSAQAEVARGVWDTPPRVDSLAALADLVDAALSEAQDGYRMVAESRDEEDPTRRMERATEGVVKVGSTSAILKASTSLMRAGPRWDDPAELEKQRAAAIEEGLAMIAHAHDVASSMAEASDVRPS